VEILHGSDEEEREGQAPLGRLESLHHTKRDLTEGFLEDPRKHLFNELRMQLQLTEIEEPSDKVGETEEYRLKHRDRALSFGGTRGSNSGPWRRDQTVARLRLGVAACRARKTFTQSSGRADR
jgi:hypothetical protein